MALKVRQQLIYNLKNTSGTGNPGTYLTIHQTDNWSKGANAAAHANLQSRKGSAATWHWQVDDKEAVQSYAENVKCWHAGDGAGKGNMASIAIEFCVNSDGNYDKTFDNAAQLAAQILKRNNIPLSRMVQHNYWSGKNCPSMIRNRSEWQKFVNLTNKYLSGASTSTPTPSAGALTLDQYWGSGTTRKAQQVFGTPADGVVSGQSNHWRKTYDRFTTGWQWVAPSAAKGSQLIAAMQTHFKKNGHKITKVDGLVGPEFVAAFTAYMGGKTLAAAIGNFQIRLNKGSK